MTATLVRPGGDGAAQRNPLREGLDLHRITEPCNVVFFGSSGDLARRMLFPAMYNLRLDDVLPTHFGIVGFSRAPDTDERFREKVRASIAEFSRSGAPSEPLWSDFARHLSYVQGDFADPSAFRKLREVLARNDQRLGTASNRVFYLATPPGAFAQIVQQLQAAGLGPRDDPRGWTRIVVEKPFGTDLASAQALQAEITKVFSEHEVYRIDHYLGKEPVQDIMALRFSNAIFEPVWNRRYVDCVQITAAEVVGVESRGGYYENAGALRDMIQNHVINLLALVAMEPPVSADADSIRDEKFKVLSALRPIAAADVDRFAVRGQYGPGLIDGKPVAGYRQEPLVDPASNTETYAAVKFLIDDWRWAEVPFYVRTGKRLARKWSEIAVQFRGVPHRLFGETGDAIE
ncbi:MAG: glucose-6-phosphate dehydrogenase, partial [Candidatus Eremiobacteraeota bacterium]|nr:glucose-6-phosphate dehydrogenase [Candidatus Eremiobacteraeota bacterium]